MWLYFLCPLPIIFAILSYIFYVKGGKKEKIKDSNLYHYPPEGLNNIDVAFIHKGYVEEKEIMPLLIHLANKGYIRIEKIKKESIFSRSKDFKIVKLREYDGNNSNEKLFLKRLFYSFNAKLSETEYKYLKKLNKLSSEEGSIDYNLKEVTYEDLYDSFLYTINDIAKSVNSKKNYYTIFDNKSNNNEKIMVFMIIISIYLILFIPTYFFRGILWESIAIPFTIIILFFLFGCPYFLTKKLG